MKRNEMTMNNIIQFKVGEKYSATSSCDHECVWTFKVLSRTEKMVRIQEEHEAPVTRKVSVYDDAEILFPFGRYSMAPILKAQDKTTEPLKKKMPRKTMGKGRVTNIRCSNCHDDKEVEIIEANGMLQEHAQLYCRHCGQRGRVRKNKDGTEFVMGPPLKGMIVQVYEGKQIGNCSNYGISSYAKAVILVGPEFPEIFEVSPDHPAVKLIRRTMCGKEYLHAEPLDPVPVNHCGWMMGGAYIHSSDSRISDISWYPIPLHDRKETAEESHFYSQ